MWKPSKGNNRRANAYRLEIRGRVQGIGFRPAVFNVARKERLNGWVANNASGALVELETTPQGLERFLQRLKASLPPHAHIKNVHISRIPPRSFKDFAIRRSRNGNSVSAEIPADICLCSDCLKELLTPSDRRYLYPFINCTNCGPRFSIVSELPYDRPRTTMEPFTMCPDCRREYDDPDDRRFHAQPNACPACGPRLKLVSGSFRPLAEERRALRETIRLLARGKIVAIKSLGGYHLACDATDRDALLRLRERKARPHKPFALMLPDLEAVKKVCHLSPEEEGQLLSPARPIVLLRKKTGVRNTFLPLDIIAPGNAYLGAMLPYTPLHFLLFLNERGRDTAPLRALVMTSGNRHDEPICRDESDVREKLSGIADATLLYDRNIHNRLDDSIVHAVGRDHNQITAIRRSRGFVPLPVPLSGTRARAVPVLSVGAELKNTFCLTRGNEAIVSQYIGELDNRETLQFFREAMERMTRFLNVDPRVVAHDLHPDYLSTRCANELLAANPRLKSTGVQHHHAHIASVLAEKQINGPVIGFAFDGTGYGLDGNIWGGECFLYAGRRFTRLAHFDYFPLPGGDAATVETWRLGLSLLRQAGIQTIPRHLRKYPCREIAEMIEKRINTPLCSSVGRLFDAFSALLGERTTTTFEAQAAIELEALAVKALSGKMDISVRKGYNFTVKSSDNGGLNFPHVITVDGMIRGILADKKKNIAPETVSLKLHATLAEIISAVATQFNERYAVNDVVLSGGVFQNRVLLSLAREKLEAKGFRVHFNEIVPCNDGGISLGQAWITHNCADETMKQGAMKGRQQRDV